MIIQRNISASVRDLCGMHANMLLRLWQSLLAGQCDHGHLDFESRSVTRSRSLLRRITVTLPEVRGHFCVRLDRVVL